MSSTLTRIRDMFWASLLRDRASFTAPPSRRVMPRDPLILLQSASKTPPRCDLKETPPAVKAGDACSAPALSLSGAGGPRPSEGRLRQHPPHVRLRPPRHPRRQGPRRPPARLVILRAFARPRAIPYPSLHRPRPAHIVSLPSLPAPLSLPCPHSLSSREVGTNPSSRYNTHPLPTYGVN